MTVDQTEEVQQKMTVDQTEEVQQSIEDIPRNNCFKNPRKTFCAIQFP